MKECTRKSLMSLVFETFLIGTDFLFVRFIRGKSINDGQTKFDSFQIQFGSFFGR